MGLLRWYIQTYPRTHANTPLHGHRRNGYQDKTLLLFFSPSSKDTIHADSFWNNVALFWDKLPLFFFLLLSVPEVTGILTAALSAFRYYILKYWTTMFLAGGDFSLFFFSLVDLAVRFSFKPHCKRKNTIQFIVCMFSNVMLILRQKWRWYFNVSKLIANHKTKRPLVSFACLS